jgi:predicted outer membrane protein
MKTTPLSALLAACLIASVPLVHAQNATEAASATAANPLSDADKAFVQAASSSSSTEIDAGKLAMTRSSDKDVKAFARHMIMDHTKLTVQLKMAAPKGVTVRRTTPTPRCLIRSSR